MYKLIKDISFYCSVLLIFVLISCGGDPEPKGNDKPVIIKNSSKLITPKGLQKVNLGDLLTVQVTGNEIGVDSIAVSYQQKQLIQLADSNFLLDSKMLNATGQVRLVVRVYLKNGKDEALYPKFNITPPAPEKVAYLKVKEYPHERSSYTQGLFFKDGQLFESTGEYGTSKLLKVDLQSGVASQSSDLPNDLFGEGMTYIGDTLYHLTYKAGKAFMYDMDFRQLQTFYYQGEGWGLTNIGDTLVMSNGTENITLRSKKDFSIYKTLAVHDDKGPVKNLNELEIIDGYLYANIYLTDKIAKIDLNNGAVVGILDLANIFTNRAAFSGSIDVLNGIAYKEGKVYVTGKNWPKLYEIKLVN